MSEVEIKPCPCGRTPTTLSVTPGDTYRWAKCGGMIGETGCCGVWEVEFRRPSRAFELDGPEVLAVAIEAWNLAPRASDHNKEAGDARP